MNYKLSHLWKLIKGNRYDFKKIENVKMQYAFSVNGISYYEPIDLNLFPWQRALAATHAYNTLQCGVYPEDLKYYFDLVDKLLTGERFDITSLINWKRMNDIIRLRLNNQFRPQELMWNVASVIFIDETESPYTYDAVYAQKKIEFWKKHEDVVLFFSQMPLQRLIPFLPATGVNSQIFTDTLKELSKIGEDIGKKQLDTLYQKQKRNLQNSRSGSSAKGTGRN